MSAFYGRIPPRPPTADECEQRTYVAEFDSYAAWYPQMGGYVGKCWVQFEDNGAALGEDSNAAMLPGGCFNVVVYHDGDFPFDGGNEPALLHHCSSEQFVRFGNSVRKFEIARQRAGRAALEGEPGADAFTQN